MDKQQIHEITLAYMNATDAHLKQNATHTGYTRVTPEEYAQKYSNYFKQVSSVLDSDTTM